MYKTMHEKANATRALAKPTTPPSTTPQTQPSSTTPAPTTRASQTTPAEPTQSTHAPTKLKLDKTLFDLLTDVTAELIVESAKLDRLGRYLTKNQK